MVTDDGRRVNVIDRATGGLATVAFALGVIALAVGGFGAVALAQTRCDHTERCPCPQARRASGRSARPSPRCSSALCGKTPAVCTQRRASRRSVASPRLEVGPFGPWLRDDCCCSITLVCFGLRMHVGSMFYPIAGITLKGCPCRVGAVLLGGTASARSTRLIANSTALGRTRLDPFHERRPLGSIARDSSPRGRPVTVFCSAAIHSAARSATSTRC